MNDSEVRSERVLELAEEFLARYRGGERPALKEYADRHPELAEEIREIFPAMALMEKIAIVDDSLGQPPPPAELPLRQVGDYRLIREVGRGGMGVVYEAEQVSLSRHIALKLLAQRALADDRQKQRFQCEARAAAKLHHTNIVPVFGVGEHDGAPYYVMQFIQGRGLNEVLAELGRMKEAPVPTVTHADSAVASLAQSLVTGDFHPGASSSETQDVSSSNESVSTARPLESLTLSDSSLTLTGRGRDQQPGGRRRTYWQSVAQVGVQVASALQYAHDQGILHRDIKPSNLLLDTRGTVWVTDFGLAKTDDQQALTHAGDIVGTIRFMAPERFDGHSLRQSDIYSLGITLYEMLVLRPAFDGSDRNRLIKRVIDDEPARPRSLNRLVPRDLETIVLKAIAKEPSRRYASAGELAEDLRRYIDDRPIKARRVSEFEKAWRWCRRNPTAAVSAGLAAVLVTLLAVGLPLGLMLRAERNRAVGYLQDAEDNLERAERAEREIRLRSHLAQARAFRNSGRPGQRFSCLDELAKASALNPTPELKDELRDETIAAHALVDLRPARTWDVPSPANFLMLDANLERYALWDRKGPIHIVRTSDQQIERTLTAPGAQSEGVYFSPDGRYLCAAYTLLGQRISWLWAVAAPTPPVLLTGEVVGFSPDGRRALSWVSLTDGQVRVFDVASAREVSRFSVGPGWHAFAFHPDGRQLAVSQEGPLEIWDSSTGKLVRKMSGITGRPVIAWHPRGSFLAAGGTVNRESVIQVWDTATNRMQAEARVPTERIGSVKFNHAGDLLLSTGWDEMYRLWDPMTGRQHLAVGGGGGIQTSFSPDDRLIAYTRTGTKITLWEVARAGVERHILGSRSFGGIHRASFSPDARLVSLSGKGLAIWDRQQNRTVSFVAEAEHGVFHPREAALLTAGRLGLHRWPLTSIETPDPATTRKTRIGPPQALTEPQDCTSISLTGDGRTAAFVDRDRLQAVIMDLDEPDESITTARHEGMASAALSPNGRWLATGAYRSAGAGQTKIWDARTGAWDRDLPHELAAGDALVLFSPDGQWLVTANPQIYRFWRVGTWEPGPAFEREEGGTITGSMAFSPDGYVLAIARTGTQVQLIDVARAVRVANLEVPESYLISSLAFSQDGAALLAGRDNQTIHIWDLRELRAVLKKLGLDWDSPGYPPPMTAGPTPVQFEVQAGRTNASADLTRAKQRVASYSRKLAANADDADAYHQRAHAYEALGDYLKAVVDFDEAIRRNPGSAHFHECRGRDLLALKEFSRTVADWARCLELKPDQPKVGNELAWLLVTGPDSIRDAKRALAYAERALQLRPEDGLILNTLGVARYRNDNFTGAINALEKSLATFHDRTAAFDLYVLAMCHAKLNESPIAKECLNRAIRWHDNHASELTTHQQQELRDFRAEAEKVLSTLR